MTVHFLNQVVNDIKSTLKSIIVIFTRLNSEPACKLINKIPGLRLLITNFPGPAEPMLVESKPRDSTSILEALSGKHDIKRHSPSILYLSPDKRFPTMRYVRPRKPQISLRIHTV